MSSKNFLATVFTIIFLLQLVTVQGSVTLPVVEYASGTFGEVSEVVQTSLGFSKKIIESRLVSTERGEYDSIIFVGDVMLARNVEQLMREEGNDYPFSGLSLRQLSSRPAIVGNFESSMAIEHVQTPVNQLKFSTHFLQIPALEEAGFTHLSLANNHSYDYGKEGYENTLDHIRNSNIIPFGHENMVTMSSYEVLTTSAGKVALVGINASAGSVNTQEVTQVLQKASKESRWQIVYIHWGVEYDTTHHFSQRQYAEFLVSLGADTIVGHHPHVVQDIEVIEGVPVFYSLGNYVFDQYFSADVLEGLVLTLALDEEKPYFTLLPVTSFTTWSQPTLMDKKSHGIFLENLAKRSDIELQEMIMSGRVYFDDNVATFKETAIIEKI